MCAHRLSAITRPHPHFTMFKREARNRAWHDIRPDLAD
jgi:hypothetical protein